MAAASIVAACALHATAHPQADDGAVVPSCIDGKCLSLAAQAPRTLREHVATRGWMPSEQSMAELEAISAGLGELGARLEGTCVWGIDQAGTAIDGRRWRELQRLLDADSRRLARRGEWAKAGDRIAAMLALSRAVGQLDRIDARALAASMAHVAAERARMLIDGGASPEAALRIVKACDALESDGMFRPREMLRLERVRWILRPVATAAARTPSKALVDSARAEPHALSDAALVASAESMTPAELEVQIRAGEAWFDALDAQCAGPDARAVAVELDARAARGEFGAWLGAVRPDMPWIIGEMDRARASVASARSRARMAAEGAGLATPALPEAAQAVSLVEPVSDLGSIPCSVGSVAVRRGDSVVRMPYRLVAPGSVRSGERYPLVVFLHGAGERGSDGASALRHFPDRMATPSMRERYPCFILAVQCPSGLRWMDADWSAATPPSSTAEPSVPMAGAIAALRRTVQDHPIDQARIYLTGLSMGGYGAWDLAARHPEWFAAAVPVCGGGDPSTAARLAALPIRAVHGVRDTVVPPVRTRAMVDAVRAAGGQVSYLEPDCGHDAWTVAYTPEGTLEWMFSQRRAQPASISPDGASGAVTVEPPAR